MLTDGSRFPRARILVKILITFLFLVFVISIIYLKINLLEVFQNIRSEKGTAEESSGFEVFLQDGPADDRLVITEEDIKSIPRDDLLSYFLGELEPSYPHLRINGCVLSDLDLQGRSITVDCGKGEAVKYTLSKPFLLLCEEKMSVASTPKVYYVSKENSDNLVLGDLYLKIFNNLLKEDVDKMKILSNSYLTVKFDLGVVQRSAGILGKEGEVDIVYYIVDEESSCPF